VVNVWAVEGEPVTLTATADKEEVTVGEAFTVEVRAEGPTGATYTFPKGLETDNAELVSGPGAGAAGNTSPPAGSEHPRGGSAPPRAGEGASTEDLPSPADRQRYEARVFALGEVALPALTVRYRLADGTEGEATASGPKVKVASLLPKDAQQQQPLVDIRGPVGVVIAPVFWVALVLALAAAGGAGHLLWRRLRRRPLEAVLPPVPEIEPAPEALQSLESLVRAGHFARGDGRGFYIALTAIAKRYLERRLGAPIVEMTTAEMLGYLRDLPHAHDLHAPMRDLAPAADQVKFAKGEALREEGDRHLAAVRAMVQRLEERLQPKPEEGKAA
jgi:hypothetical protein